MDELVREFVSETRDMLEAASASIVAWETDPAAPGLIDEIFRFVHTVKGSCGFLDLPRIAALAHAAEEVLGAARDGRRQPDGQLVSAMLAIVDRIAQLVDALDTGSEVPDAESDQPLIAALHGSGAATRREAGATTAVVKNTLRIPVALLEQMMNEVSDLVLARNELARRLRSMKAESAVTSAFTGLSQGIAALRDSVGRARLQPIERLFRALPRLVRDTAATVGKAVELSITGDDVEIDREMLEALRDPLVHIIRNAIDHGVELKDQRLEAGKPAAGQLRVSARQSGNQVSIAISDDGRGINVERLCEKAVAAGVVSADAVLTPERALNLIFEAGLSTAAAVTEISGRGVGMDVVRANIERLGGTISLQNQPGRGLTVTLRVPLTLSILPALIVQAGGQRFAVPRSAIDEVLSVRSPHVRLEALGDGHVAAVRGQLLSTIPLDRTFALPVTAPAHLVIIDAAGLRYAIPVGATLEHEELVVRPLAPALATAGVFAGQSLPDDGQPLALLDPIGLAERAGVSRSAARRQERAVDSDAGERVLTFDNLRGERQAIRAAQVERIEDVPLGSFARVGERNFALLDGSLRPAVLDGPLPPDELVVTLRLLTPHGLVARPVRRVHDLAPLGALTLAESPECEGLLLLDGRPVPLARAVPLTERIAA